MRSAVSYMLSHAPGETSMSRPDYEQCAFHHGCLLVLLRGVGPSKPRSLQKVFEKVRRVNNVKITDSTGLTRDIWIRYIHDHPVENNDWGDFQTHRRLLGLITIGKFENQLELNEICRQHESLKVRYGGTLYDSRAIFFGPAAAEKLENNVVVNHHEQQDDVLDEWSKTDLQNAQPSSEQQQHNDDAQSQRLEDIYTTPSNFKARAFFYREYDACDDLETHITEFLNSLFWVLESKRLERSREKVDKVSLLLAPLEKRDFVGLDMDSRNNKKRCMGRVTKHLADLYLQAGLVEESLSLYHSACETLRAIGDALWVGAAEEGLCATSALLLYPHMREVETLRRNASLQEGSSPLRGAPAHWRASDLTKKFPVSATTDLNDSNVDHACKNVASASIPLANTTVAASNSSSSSSVSSMLTTGSTSSSTTSSSSTSTISVTVTQTHRNHDLPGNILKPDEILGVFRKAIINYSKYRQAAIVETESALKAARICIEQGKPLDVAMFLQSILSISLSMTEQERVKRFEVITDLYQQIGYQRKAAFFQRMAALKHVQAGNLNPDWSQSYRLMLASFPGYTLSLDPLEVIENAAGWPSLQIDMLQGLISAARRLGHSALATRHMTFLLQTQWANMTLSQQREMAEKLQDLSAQCEGSPVPLVLEHGTVIPPANLTDLPYCLDLVVKDMPAHLRPQRIKIVKADSGPFLFTPIHFSSIDRREKKKDKNKIAFFWVQHDLSEITLRLRNPLPFELVVSDMRLLTDGIVFESLPQTVTLQPNMPTLITLHGTPIEVGQLEIQGYSTHTLGVKSNCRLKHMRGRNFPLNYLVEVIPALPRISAKMSLPQTGTISSLASAELVITSASLTLYSGESSTCVVTIINDSTLPVEHLEVAIHSNVELEVQRKMFKINEEDLQSKLPIPPKSFIDFTVYIFGEADFICPVVSQHAASIHSNGTSNTLQQHQQQQDLAGLQSLQYSNFSSSGHASLPSSVSSPNAYATNAGMRRNEYLSSSFRSGPTSSLAALSIQPGGGSNEGTQFAQHIEAQFRIKYSGGEAMQAGYCRQCAISFNLELLPSAQITSWDVLPAEIPAQFYLVLDVSNLTAQEMSLNYTESKSILIEAKESCRVPIPVDRCSLEQVCKAREAEHAENMERELCFRTQLLSFSDSISKLCSEHIAERVNMSWLLTGTDIKGIATLRGIVLTTAMIDLTTVSPLQWTVLFQNAPVQPQSEIVCVAGQSATLSVNVCNLSVQPLKNLVLTIKFYQDYLNGMENYNLETRVILSGPNKVAIPLLQKDASAQHECSVIFFTPGRFKTSIQCDSKPQTTTTTTHPSLLSQTCRTHESSGKTNSNTNSQLESAQADLLNDPSGVNSYHEQQEHIWKFIPPIEVTVVEQ